MRLTTVAVAALATVVLTVGLAAAAVVEEASSRPAEQAGRGNLRPSQLSGTEVVDEPQAPPPAAAAPPPATVAAPKPAAAGPAAAPLPGHRTPGGVVTGFKAGRTEWSGVSNGMSIRLVMSTTSPRAGEPVTFVAEASMPGGLCCNLMMEFGDGSEGAYPPRPGLGPIDCARLEPKSNSVRGEMSHVYNKAGRWNFSVTARSGSGCHVSNPPSAYGSLYGVLEIGGGSSAPTGGDRGRRLDGV